MKNKNYTDVLDQCEIASIAEDIAETSLDLSTKNKMKQRILGNIKSECPDGGFSVRANKKPWIKLTDNISIQILYQDLENKFQTALWRLKPGTVIPGHYHNHDEECLLLEGEVSFAGYTLYPGDFHMMKKGSRHPDMHSRTGALFYLKHDIHEDLGWLKV